jgi:hypothetical protein
MQRSNESDFLGCLTILKKDFEKEPSLLAELVIPQDNLKVNVVQNLIRKNYGTDNSENATMLLLKKLKKFKIQTDVVVEILVRKCDYKLNLFQYFVSNGKGLISDVTANLLTQLKKVFGINALHVKRLLLPERDQLNLVKFLAVKRIPGENSIQNHHLFKMTVNFFTFLKNTFNCNIKFILDILLRECSIETSFMQYLVKNHETDKNELKDFQKFLLDLKKKFDLKFEDLSSILVLENFNNFNIFYELLQKSTPHGRYFNSTKDFFEFLKSKFDVSSDLFAKILSIDNGFGFNIFQRNLVRSYHSLTVKKSFSNIFEWAMKTLNFDKSTLKSILSGNPESGNWIIELLRYNSFYEDYYELGVVNFELLPDILDYLKTFFGDDREFFAKILVTHKSVYQSLSSYVVKTKNFCENPIIFFLDLLTLLNKFINIDDDMLSKLLEQEQDSNLIFTVLEKSNGYPLDEFNEILDFLHQNFQCSSKAIMDLLAPEGYESFNLVQFVLNNSHKINLLKTLVDILDNLKKNFQIGSDDVVRILSTKDDYDLSILHNILLNSRSDGRALQKLLDFFTYLKITFSFDCKSLGHLFSVQGPLEVSLIRTLISHIAHNQIDVKLELLKRVFNYLKNEYCFSSDLILEFLISRDYKRRNIIDELHKDFANHTIQFENLQNYFKIEFNIVLQEEYLKWIKLSKSFAKKWITKAKHSVMLKSAHADLNLPAKNERRQLPIRGLDSHTYENVELKLTELPKRLCHKIPKSREPKLKINDENIYLPLDAMHYDIYSDDTYIPMNS